MFVFLRRARHVASIVTLFVAVACASLPAEQNKDRNPSQEPNGKAIGDTSTTGSDDSTNPPRDDADEQQREPQILGLRLGSWAELLTVAVTICAVLAAFRTIVELRTQVTHNKTAADAAKDAADAAKASVAHLQAIERAYVHMTHKEGLHLSEPDLYRLQIEVVNRGRTPATLHFSRITIAPFLDKTGITPDWQTSAGSYLHTNSLRTTKVFFPNLPDRSLTDLIQLQKLWIVGEIEYTDIFNKRHRAGYCRWVKPGLSHPKNNLVFDETTSRYNYDIEITPALNDRVNG